MARRRLPAPGAALGPLPPEGEAPLEVKSAYPLGVAPQFTRPPVARVAAESAAEAALRELSSQMQNLRAEGRMVLELGLDQIDEAYLLRDRQMVDPEEMAALILSLRAHGQRQPIEVADLGEGRFGLIAGWRRLTALRALRAEEPARFGTVLALVRAPETAAEAYVAMIEENEIRAGLSYWERARLVVRATEAGVFADQREALRALFAAASRAKRSKIGSFTLLVEALDGVLHYPAQLPERAGLGLVKAMEADPALGGRLRAALSLAPSDAAAEQALIAAVLAGKTAGGKPAAKEPSPRREIGEGLWLESHKAGITLGGKAVTAAFLARLEDWLRRETGA